MRNRGYGIIIDAVFALTVTMILFTTLIGMSYSGSSPSDTSFKRLHYVSEDALDVLNKKGILDQVGEYWAAANGNQSSEEFINATNISTQYLDELIPPNMGYMLTVDDELIANETRGIDPDNSLVKTHSTRLLVGYGRGMPTRGHVARSFLSNIREKETSEYAYFGGFIGQGNITTYLRGLPVDVNVNRACFELNTLAPFDAYVNDNYAGTFTPSGTSMNATIKGSAGCVQSAYLNSFTSGDNRIDLKFSTSNFSLMYVGGGYLQVTYNTSQMDTDEISDVGRYYFPGVDGLINIYDSFYVPGRLESLNAYLHYTSNYSVYLNIGGITVFNSSGNMTEQNMTLTNEQLESSGLVYYPDMSENTIPVRMGTGNFSYTITSGSADVVLITDMSGSMLRCLNSNNYCTQDSHCPGSRCRWPYAKELDKQFIEMVLNTTGNRVGLVTYSYNAYNRHDLSNNEADLNQTVDGLATPDGGTCICCAIRMARNMLEEQSNEYRDKYIIVMTDGIANIRCSISDEDRTSCCSQYYCSSPTCGYGLYWSGTCSDYLDDTAIDNAINDSLKSHEELNATVNTIGFGAGAIGCNVAVNALQNISRYGNGTYCASDNPADLLNCYVDIADKIFTTSQKSQTVYFGGVLSNSTIYPDSYIEYEYTPGNESTYGEVSITQSSDPFNDPTDCTGEVTIPANVVVSDFKVTSYSSNHWTDYLRIDNTLYSHEAYRLWSDYGGDYTPLGDPYIVNVPADYVVPGDDNIVTIETGDNQSSRTGCSGDDRAIYTLRIQSLVGYGNIHSESVGCDWNIEFEDGTTYSASIPSYYNESEVCNYTTTSRHYDEDDAIDDSVFRLMSNLDLDNDSRVDLLFDPDMIGFELSSAGGVQSLWGPAKFKLIIWM
ncbi:MAG: vWA domain-containing protein [Candidatus Altiarchaeota archaeon]